MQGKRVVVIGGGDTAVDCVATSIRLGAKQLSLFLGLFLDLQGVKAIAF